MKMELVLVIPDTQRRQTLIAQPIMNIHLILTLFVPNAIKFCDLDTKKLCTLLEMVVGKIGYTSVPIFRINFGIPYGKL